MSTGSQPVESRPPTRWSWVVIFQTIVLLALAFDWIPYLRGPDNFPPEWRWRYSVSTVPLAVIATFFLGLAIAATGWLMDKESDRLKRRLLFSAILALGLLLQLAGTWTRGRDLGLTLAQRTTIVFLEDFFEAARSITKPSEAFTRYTWLAETKQNRVGTHPPGLIWLYKEFISAGSNSTALLPLSDSYFGAEDHYAHFRDEEKIAILYATWLKLLCCPLFVAAAVLLFQTLFPGAIVYTGRFAALVSVVPAVVAFSFCFDQILAVLTVLAIAFFLKTLGQSKVVLFAILCGLTLFLQSMLAYQTPVTFFIITITAVIVIARKDFPSCRKHVIYTSIIAAATLLFLWSFVAYSTGFQFLAELAGGISRHHNGGIHQQRSRWLWLIWNQWDVIFFFGLAWLPILVRRELWKSWRTNPLLIAIAAAWFIITVTDSIRGETARLVLFLFPLLACACAGGANDIFSRRNYAILSLLLIVQTTIFAAVLVPF